VDSLNNPISGAIIFEEESGELWIGNKRNGLLKITRPFKKVKQNTVTPTKTVHYKAEPGDSFGLNVNRVDDLFKAHTGTIWLGTFGGGLNKLERKKNESTGEITERFFHYTTKDGLPTDAVSSIIEDKNGNLWIGSENGLSKFNPTTEIFKNYDKSDGLSTLDITGKFYYSPWGEIFIASNDGVLAFYPDSIIDNPIIPLVVITDFRLFNKPVQVGESSPLTKSITTTKEIELPFNKNTFSFEFAALNFMDTDKNRYKYMLEGSDDDWVYAGTRRFVEYHGLNPGTYTFRVSGSNNDGVWNEEGASIKVIIHPPWWRTMYAYTGYLIFIFILIYGYVRLRTQQLKKDKIKLEKKVKERTQKIEEHEKKIEELGRIKTRFFTNVSHEFRTPLTLIQGPVDELMENERLSIKVHKKLEMVRRNARRLLALVNQLLDVSKVESGKMKLVLREGDIFETLRIIAGSFSSLAEANGIIYNRHIPNIEKHTWYDAEMVEKIVVNLLSNAFKFSSEAGEVNFKAELVEGENNGSSEILEFSVSDQGPGIPANSQDKIFNRFYQEENSGKKMSAGTGIGLSLTRDLVDLNHGEISVESEPDKGSTFTVKFPLGKDHLKESEYVFSEKEKEQIYMKPEIVNGSQETVMSDIEEAVPGKQIEKPIILIVEDNRDIRIHIRGNFEKEYSVMEAIDGSAGLKKAIDTLPDLIITDLMMPKMDGMELCQQIKNDERTSHIPVIILTAKSTLGDKLEGYETGADDYIAKPFQMKELMARVHNLIEQRRKLRERFSREVTLEPRDITVNSYDEEFLKRAIDTVENHMSDEDFDINIFQKELNMSHSTLYRKLYSLTNLSPTGFVRSVRIKRAAQLIKQHYGNIAKISYEVGFNNPSYFSKCFKEVIGISPAEYSKN